MVIRGGENVYPREVEEFIYRHPAVQTVQVFGVPDKRQGEELACWIILRPVQRPPQTRSATSAGAPSRITRCPAMSTSSPRYP